MEVREMKRKGEWGRGMEVGVGGGNMGVGRRWGIEVRGMGRRELGSGEKGKRDKGKGE